MNREFDEAATKLLQLEGGYVNDPNDPGGETKYGISKRSYPHLEIKDLSEAQAKKIYWTDFWLKNRCEEIEDAKIAQKLFEFSANLGNVQAAKLFQRAINDCARALGYKTENWLKEDGIIGNITLSAFSNLYRQEDARKAFLTIFKTEAANFYRGIAKEGAAQRGLSSKFLNGWLNRAYA